LEILEEERGLMDSLMPSLVELYSQEKNKPIQETRFFKGINGLKSVFEDQLDLKKEIFVIGASEKAYEMMDLYFHWYDKKRVLKKIKTKLIFNKTSKKIHRPLSEIKYFSEKYSSNMAINIYGDRVAIILWKKENPISILIKDFELAEAYKKHFEIMWSIAKK